MLQTLLTTHDVAYATSVEQLFSKVSVTVRGGDRIALIGKNGVGKTTFLKILEGTIVPDTGTILRNGGVGCVPQLSKESRCTMAVKELIQSKQCSYAQFSKAYARIFSSDVPQASCAVDTMSGGERTKLWIACVVSLDPGILLLDEPTNHLDRKSIEELGVWMQGFSGAVVFVSHNRYFVSATARIVWELEQGVLSVFGGSYVEYLQKKGQDAHAQARQYEATKKELRSLEAGMRMRETKAARADVVHRKNKVEPSRNKSAEDYFRNRSERGIGKIKKQHDEERVRLKEKLQSLRKSTDKTVSMSLETRIREGKLIMDTEDLAVRVGGRLLVRVPRLRIEVGDRICISGDNGTGKTLLLKTLMYEMKHPTKDITKTSVDIRVAYIDQHYELIDRTLTVLQNLEQSMKEKDRERVYKQLGRFQFGEQYAHKKVSELSGGEVARLAFAIATITPLDLLVLDEPTNNLDIETMDILSGALKDFSGALLIVSHDSFFLDHLDITEKYMIEDGVLVSYTSVRL